MEIMKIQSPFANHPLKALQPPRLIERLTPPERRVVEIALIKLNRSLADVPAERTEALEKLIGRLWEIPVFRSPTNPKLRQSPARFFHAGTWDEAHAKSWESLFARLRKNNPGSIMETAGNRLILNHNDWMEAIDPLTAIAARASGRIEAYEHVEEQFYNLVFDIFKEKSSETAYRQAHSIPSAQAVSSIARIELVRDHLDLKNETVARSLSLSEEIMAIMMSGYVYGGESGGQLFAYSASAYTARKAIPLPEPRRA